MKRFLSSLCRAALTLHSDPPPINYMKTALIIFLTVASMAQAKPPEGYELAWADEFDGAALDTNQWFYRLDSNWNSTQQAKNVSLNNGLLRIALKHESARGKNYTGGGVITKRNFVYGYYEARFKVPATLGWHTSFWMSAYDETNPNKVGGIGLHEMDVCEHDSWKHDSYTRALWMRKPKDPDHAPKLPGWKRIPTPDLTKDFHVWGCEFTPTNVRYFFDGEEIQDWDVSAYQTGEQRIWLTSIAANISKKTGDPVDAELPAYAEYDYVRFYEPEPAATIIPVEAPAVTNAPDASIPLERKDPYARQLHETFLQRGKEGPVGLLFLGDSITAAWRATWAQEMWTNYFGKYQPANFGIGSDATQHVLWRITHGELDGIDPKVIVLLLGTNNIKKNSPTEIAEADAKIVKLIREKLPNTKVLLLGIFPRAHKTDPAALKVPERVKSVNARLAKLDDGVHVRYLDIGDQLAPGGKVTTEIYGDGVHLKGKGYQIWAKAITPLLQEMMK